MGAAATRPLLFLATCLGFAETVIGALAGLTGANATVLAGFAMGSLGMVLATLVAMYWREPAFLTFSGEQALDLRRLQEILRNVPAELIPDYLGSITERDLAQGVATRIAFVEDTTEEEADEIEREMGNLR